jgi:hypothetical protein
MKKPPGETGRAERKTDEVSLPRAKVRGKEASARNGTLADRKAI